jgi:hypothetical protein
LGNHEVKGSPEHESAEVILSSRPVLNVKALTIARTFTFGIALPEINFEIF